MNTLGTGPRPTAQPRVLSQFAVSLLTRLSRAKHGLSARDLVGLVHAAVALLNAERISALLAQVARLTAAQADLRADTRPAPAVVATPAVPNGPNVSLAPAFRSRGHFAAA